MPKYRFTNDFRGAAGSFRAGDEIELDPADRLVVDGFVTAVNPPAVEEPIAKEAPAPKTRRSKKE